MLETLWTRTASGVKIPNSPRLEALVTPKYREALVTPKYREALETPKYREALVTPKYRQTR